MIFASLFKVRIKTTDKRFEHVRFFRKIFAKKYGSINSRSILDLLNQHLYAMNTTLSIRPLLVLQLVVFCNLASLAQDNNPSLNSVYLKPLKTLEVANHYPRISLGVDGHIIKN